MSDQDIKILEQVLEMISECLKALKRRAGCGESCGKRSERDWEYEHDLVVGSKDCDPRASTTTVRRRMGSRSSGSGQIPVQETQLERARA